MTKAIVTPILTGTLALAVLPLASASLTTLASTTPALAAADADDHDSFRARPCGNPATPMVADDGRRSRAASSLLRTDGRRPVPAPFAPAACAFRI